MQDLGSAWLVAGIDHGGPEGPEKGKGSGFEGAEEGCCGHEKAAQPQIGFEKPLTWCGAKQGFQEGKVCGGQVYQTHPPIPKLLWILGLSTAQKDITAFAHVKTGGSLHLFFVQIAWASIAAIAHSVKHYLGALVKHDIGALVTLSWSPFARFGGRTESEAEKGEERVQRRGPSRWKQQQQGAKALEAGTHGGAAQQDQQGACGHRL